MPLTSFKPIFSQEESEESEPRNAITDLSVDGHSDNIIGKRKRLDKETGDNIATEIIGDIGKGSSARPGKLQKVVPVHTYFEGLTWMRKTSRVITNVLEDCQKNSQAEIGTLLERQEENLEKLRLYIQQRWAKESKENGICDCIFSKAGLRRARKMAKVDDRKVRDGTCSRSIMSVPA
ncbi:hypothetical protein V501_01106 [Pseudogymnoascus sp. VKM F-4519 (FW-2642)]|nr:hypothetical protein V501_01106 [Pseudogymnoascus sp. VKM F-4519 (FW-2642)]